jgi:DMSO/TMAO reductase YedYZ molybdopterin-dependent catalytic subunit
MLPTSYGIQKIHSNVQYFFWGMGRASLASWVLVESSVNLDASGNRDPYFMSVDLATARHSQTLLATHLNGQPLTVEHGAPLRLLVPVKLGLKNAKAITKLTYVAEEPRDYWAERGYSRYDGI